MAAIQLFDKQGTLDRLKSILDSDDFHGEVAEHFADCLHVLVMANDWCQRRVSRVSDGVVYTPEHLKNDLNMFMVDVKLHALFSECQIQLLAYLILWSCSCVEHVEVHKRRCNRVPFIYSATSVEDIKCMLFYRSQDKAFIVEIRALLENDTLDYPGKFGRFSWYDNDPVELIDKPMNHGSGHVQRMFVWQDPKPATLGQLLDRLTQHTAALIPRSNVDIHGYAGIIVQELYNCKNVCFVQERAACVSPILYRMSKSKDISSMVQGFFSLGLDEHEAIFEYFHVRESDFSQEQLYQLYHFTKWLSKEVKGRLRMNDRAQERSAERARSPSSSRLVRSSSAQSMSPSTGKQLDRSPSVTSMSPIASAMAGAYSATGGSFYSLPVTPAKSSRPSTPNKARPTTPNRFRF